METIKGHIENIVYQSSENGFTVARLKKEDTSKLLTIIGPMPSLKAGESVVVTGVWQTHPDHGKQFYVHSIQTIQPSSTVGIQKYLESGLIQGIGPVYAKKIVETFGETTLAIIENTPERLREVAGLGEKRILQIVESWRKQRSIRDVMIFLQGHHISPAYAQKIYQTYKEESIAVVTSRPYDLAKHIHGIGFKMADTIALRVGFQKDSVERIVAGICHLLWENGVRGHTCLPIQTLEEEATRVLEVEPKQIQEGIKKALLEKLIVEEKKGGTSFFWLRFFHETEKGIAKEILRLLQGGTAIREIHLEKAIDWVEKELSLHLAEEQKEAITASLEKNVHIITGGPGTGKSTITSAIITILSKVTGKIVLAAPTGRAAKRLTQITRKKALTIHSLLEPDFSLGGFKRGKSYPIRADCLIVDELSMVAEDLFHALLLALENETKLILIGDEDQLPSVGPGSVLKDLIAAGVIGATKLQKIFRQAKGSKIVVNAHKVNRGEFPEIGASSWSDFQFYGEENPDEIVKKILHLVQEEIPKKKKLHPIWDIQILTPMKKGSIGTQKLNEALQNVLNPQNEALLRGGREFRIHDKVLQTKNNYQKHVFNGEFGEIIAVDKKLQKVTIAFDQGKMVEYEFSELDEVELAYAVSIHKSQGSEFPCVIIPMHVSHYPLLSRPVLYTAITRGKKLVVVLGQKKAIGTAVKNDASCRRHTGLKEAIQKEASSQSPSVLLELPFN